MPALAGSPISILLKALEQQSAKPGQQWPGFVPMYRGTNMDRRTFITLAAGGLCFASRNAVSGRAIASELGGKSARGSHSATEEPFPISFEDYETVDTDYVPRLVDY